MTELKTHFVDDLYKEYYETGKHALAQVYLKSEVDRVIAELRAQIVQADAECANALKQQKKEVK